MSRGVRNESQLAAIEVRLEVIENWRAELRGAMNLMRLALGTSVLSAIIAMLTLIRMLLGVA
jgi:hypothetical protein